MTSHISVSVAPTSGGSPTGFSPLGHAGKSTGKSGFAALLAAIGDNGGTAGDAAKALESLLQPGADGTTTLAVPLSATADANAANATDSAAATGAAAGVLKQLVDALAELQKTLQGGETPSDDLLKRVKKAVDAVANVLAVPAPLASESPAASKTGDNGNAVDAVGAAGSGATGATSEDDPATGVDAARARLAALDQKLTDLAGEVGATHPDVAQKLNDLAATLDPDKLSAATLSQLGLGDGSTAPDTSLANALSALASTPSPTAAATPQPALAAPQLKLPSDSALAADPASKTPATGPAPPAPAPAVHTLTATAVPAAQNPAPGGDGASKDQRDQKAADEAAAAATATTTAPADKSAAATPSAGASAAAATTGPAPSTPAPAATTLAANTAYQSAAAVPLNVPQLAVDIARQVQQGTSHFQVRLDPADLGRVDVRLSIDSTGATTARLTVERPDTLDLLRRDQNQLGAALSQAGLDAGKTDLQFSLSQNPFTRQDTGGGGGAPTYVGPTPDGDEAADPVAPLPTSAYRLTLAPQGLNIIV